MKDVGWGMSIWMKDEGWICGWRLSIWLKDEGWIYDWRMKNEREVYGWRMSLWIKDEYMDEGLWIKDEYMDDGWRMSVERAERKDKTNPGAPMPRLVMLRFFTRTFRILSVSCFRAFKSLPRVSFARPSYILTQTYQDRRVRFSLKFLCQYWERDGKGEVLQLISFIKSKEIF